MGSRCSWWEATRAAMPGPTATSTSMSWSLTAHATSGRPGLTSRSIGWCASRCGFGMWRPGWPASKSPRAGRLGLPAVETVRLCWVADDSWRARLERSQLAHPPGEPELDHLVGDLGKVANAWRRGDELGLRLAAQDLARSCPSLLQPLNPHPPVGSRQAALLTALDFAVVPPGYHDDLVVCLGLAGRPTSAAEVHFAACRLATGVVELLGSHAGRFTRLLPRPLAASLTDGSLRRYVGQLVRNPSR
jgi:hypothetical protein